MHVIDGVELRRALPMRAAIDALEAGFGSQDPSAQPLRSHLATPAVAKRPVRRARANGR